MDAYITQPHHLDHAAPVWHALDPSLRGRLFVGFDERMISAVMRYGFEGYTGMPPDSNTPVLIASGNELVAVKRAVLLEHGVGQHYEGVEHVCWSGGPGRDNVVLFVVPNAQAAAANRARYPDTPCAVVGSPHVETLRKLPPYPLRDQRIAISAHWDAGHLVPELRSGWPWFEDAYERLCRASPDAFVLHGHPRYQQYTEWKAREWGVEFEPSFAALTQRAWCYVTDNSSTLYEWAALNRPVVVVSPPWYYAAGKVEHGIRFWSMSDPGPHIYDPDDLESAISVAIADPAPIAQRRQEIVRELFGEDVSEGAAARAARAIEEVVGGE